MKRAILRAVINIHAREVSISPPLRILRSGSLLARFPVLTSLQPRCHSSGNDKPNELNSTTNQNKDSLFDDDVSIEELKRKIEKFYEGDVESLPSIFEAILKRKLSGKHGDADDELMKEIRELMPGQVEDFKYDEDDTDFGEWKKTDGEMVDFSDASDSEEEDRKV